MSVVARYTASDIREIDLEVMCLFEQRTGISVRRGGKSEGDETPQCRDLPKLRSLVAGV